jgi:ribonuclease HI
MPWIEALLRGQKVYAKAKADGQLDAQEGRVEIRYKPNDGRAYRAMAGNLKVLEGARLLPDEACGPGEAVAPKEERTKERAAVRVPKARPAGPLWTAYTDGACSGNPGPAGAGLIVISPEGKAKEGFEYLGQATNNIAELAAILFALNAIPPAAEHVLVHTDSQYAIGVLTKGWKAKKNPELIEKIRTTLKSRKNVEIIYVPGHAGVPLNERADELAREAIRTRKSQRISI